MSEVAAATSNQRLVAVSTTRSCTSGALAAARDCRRDVPSSIERCHARATSAPPCTRRSTQTIGRTKQTLIRGQNEHLPALILVARRITFRHTDSMAKAISVRLDDDAERALRLLQSTGLTRSEAIRSSLLASADRMRRRSQLAAEVAALEADTDDRDEMLAVASLMESMRAAG